MEYFLSTTICKNIVKNIIANLLGGYTTPFNHNRVNNHFNDSQVENRKTTKLDILFIYLFRKMYSWYMENTKTHVHELLGLQFDITSR
jgi:hypothetical protein